MLATEVKDFKTAINDIVSKVEETQLAIFQSANANVMDLYFYIGKVIDDRIRTERVKKVIGKRCGGEKIYERVRQSK